MSEYLSEYAVEKHAIDVLEKQLAYPYLHGSRLVPAERDSSRRSFREPILLDRLSAALARLNPSIDADIVHSTVNKVTGHETTDIVANNLRFHDFIVEGVPYEYRDTDGNVRHDHARIVDLENPDANDWLVVNQFTIREDHRPRRPDVVIFVNGIPIGLIEFKDPTDENATIESAFEQLQTYKAEIPAFCAFNEFMVISDGVEARLGSLTADYSRFQAWRSLDQAPSSEPEITTLLNGIFEKRRLLDILRYFVLFESDGVDTSKKIAAYHQYRAANKSVTRTIDAISEDGNRRIGVVWHTQGSGKSLTTVFYSGKIVQQPEMENPTLVVITDRNDLDGQLFGQFSRCKEFLRQEPVQIESRRELSEHLSVPSGGIVFTTIQKFLPEERGAQFPALSERRNIVVIADEAHRSQYDTIDGFARHMRDALPNASFIGFTGTPIETGDRNTRAVFGDYIDTYDIAQAVHDGATVPIYYEGRIAKLRLKPEEIPHIDPDFEEITEGEEEARKTKIRTKWASIEALVGAEHRLEEVAKDLVAHFEERTKSLAGKGLIVCMSRRICVAMYDEIAKLRPDWGTGDDKTGEIKVVMTGTASDGPMWQKHIRAKKGLKEIERRFKDPEDPLRLVIVRDMWLTGFDAPCLHTMYMDKPMHGHSLMQAIARVNRVFRDKPGGLTVDYLGLADDLRKALAIYAQSGKGDLYLDESKAVAALQSKFEIVRDMFHGFNFGQLLTADAPTKMKGLIDGADFILGLEKGRERFLQNVSDLTRAFALASTSDFATSIRDETAFFQAVRATIAKSSARSGRSHAEIETAVRQLVSKAVASEGIVDILSEAGIKKPDISILSDEFLAEVKDLPQRNLARELLEKLISDEIKRRSRTNAVQARRFSEMLAAAVQKYENRSIETTQLINMLIEIAKELKAEPDRAKSMGLTEDEVAFYDALAENDSAVQVLGDKQLRVIARELLKAVKSNVTIDWTLREGAKAKIRTIIKRILRAYGYPPDAEKRAVDTVLEQAEILCHSEAA